MDGVVYMMAAGTGFAVWVNYHRLSAQDHHVFLSIAAAQAVITTLAHASFAGVLGYVLGRARFSRSTPLVRSALLFAGLLGAAALNGQFGLVEMWVSTSGLARRDLARGRLRGGVRGGGLRRAAAGEPAPAPRLAVPARGRAMTDEPRPDSGAEPEDDRADGGGQAGDGSLGRRFRRATTGVVELGGQLRGHSQRLDLLVVVLGLAIVAGAARLHRRLVTPDTVVFTAHGLTMTRSAAWLAPEFVPTPAPRLIEALPRPNAGGLPYHVELTSSLGGDARLEVMIEPLPPWSNLGLDPRARPPDPLRRDLRRRSRRGPLHQRATPGCAPSTATPTCPRPATSPASATRSSTRPSTTTTSTS